VLSMTTANFSVSTNYNILLLHRFKLADEDVTKNSVTLASDDVTDDDVSALAAADESSVSTARKSSHHGDSLCLIIKKCCLLLGRLVGEILTNMTPVIKVRRLKSTKERVT